MYTNNYKYKIQSRPQNVQEKVIIMCLRKCGLLTRFTLEKFIQSNNIITKYTNFNTFI